MFCWGIGATSTLAIDVQVSLVITCCSPGNLICGCLLSLLLAPAVLLAGALVGAIVGGVGCGTGAHELVADEEGGWEEGDERGGIGREGGRSSLFRLAGGLDCFEVEFTVTGAHLVCLLVVEFN